MTPKLVVVAGPNRGTEVPLTGRIIFNIGSDRGSTVFLDDTRVAPNHCRLYNEDSKFTLFDVSGKGMQVNGKRVVKSVLNDGDVIALGQSQLRFVIRDAGASTGGGAPLAMPASGPVGVASAPPGYGPPPGYPPAAGAPPGYLPPSPPMPQAPAAAFGAPPASPSASGRDDFRMNLQSGAGGSKYARVWLQCVEGNDKGKIFDLSEGTCWVIGRGHSADITVMDIKVSRAHTRIDRQGDTFFVNDLNSTNGTFVNGQQIERQELHRGDYVKSGYTILCFQYETVEEAQAAGRAPPRPLDPAAIAGLRDDPFSAQLGSASGRTGMPGAPFAMPPQPAGAVPMGAVSMGAASMPMGGPPMGAPPMGVGAASAAHPGGGLPPGYGMQGPAPGGYPPPPGPGAPFAHLPGTAPLPPASPSGTTAPGYGPQALPPGYGGGAGSAAMPQTAGPFGAPPPFAGAPGAPGFAGAGSQMMPGGAAGLARMPGGPPAGPPPLGAPGMPGAAPGSASAFVRPTGPAAVPGGAGAASSAMRPGGAPAGGPPPGTGTTAAKPAFEDIELNFDALDDGAGDPFGAAPPPGPTAPLPPPSGAALGVPPSGGAGGPPKRARLQTADIMIPDVDAGLFDDPGLGSGIQARGPAPAGPGAFPGAPAAGGPVLRCFLCNEAYPPEAVGQGRLTIIQGNPYCQRCLQR